MTVKLRIGEPYHVVYYAPLRVAQLGGFFDQEGLDVEIVPSVAFSAMAASPSNPAAGAEIAVGGIMRSLVAYDQGQAPVPVHFARVNDRDGFLLLGRNTPFEWPDLVGRRLIVFGEAPTPWRVLRSLLLDLGLDADRVQVVDTIPIGEAAGAFRAGAGDYLLTQAHVAAELIRTGDAVLLREMANEAGPLPYSSYYCRPSYLDSNPEAIAAVCRAHARAMAWMRKHNGREIWETIKPSFEEGLPGDLREATERYRNLATWMSDTTLPLDSYTALATAMQRGGLIERVAPYADVIKDGAARAAESAVRDD